MKTTLRILLLKNPLDCISGITCNVERSTRIIDDSSYENNGQSMYVSVIFELKLVTYLQECSRGGGGF
jgi:hypothetical protein